MSPRPETKTRRVQALLARPEGASLAAITAATGWQAHSARAALSMLRKAGHPIARGEAADGTTVYRIDAPAQSATAPGAADTAHEAAFVAPHAEAPVAETREPGAEATSADAAPGAATPKAVRGATSDEATPRPAAGRRARTA